MSPTPGTWQTPAGTAGLAGWAGLATSTRAVSVAEVAAPAGGGIHRRLRGAGQARHGRNDAEHQQQAAHRQRHPGKRSRHQSAPEGADGSGFALVKRIGLGMGGFLDQGAGSTCNRAIGGAVRRGAGPGR